jgi:hypothetical protein
MPLAQRFSTPGPAILKIKFRSHLGGWRRPQLPRRTGAGSHSPGGSYPDAHPLPAE